MLGMLVAACAAAATAATAQAAPLGLTNCATNQGFTQCSGLVTTWDGVPLDTTVTLPEHGTAGLPLVVNVHGFGNSKHEYLDPASKAYTDNAYGWARAGYAVLTATARGLWGSCGSPEARLANPLPCARGWIHLADTRFEVRDQQHLVGLLVDDGTADARRIAVTGDSYGGGTTLALATLNDRVMLPDGRLVPWRSPKGTPLSVAAAAPVIPWTNLIGAIAPNGRTRHGQRTPPQDVAQPVGVFKMSVATAIAAAAQFAIGPGQPVGQPFVPGRPMGQLAAPGVDRTADVGAWVARADLGEPYTDPLVRGYIADMQHFHSAAGVPMTSAPPPLLLASGFTDDLFPASEVLRHAEEVRAAHPATPVQVLLGDFGHQRAANKPADRERLVERIHAWFDHHVMQRGAAPPTGVTATTQTCPKTAPSEGPFHAATFNALATGEQSFTAATAKTVLSTGGDPQTALGIDPATGGGDGCVRSSARDWPGTAVYRLPLAPPGGILMLGAPRVTAKLTITGVHPQLAVRLWDVGPEGKQQSLVARALVRPTRSGEIVFELNANGWRFGHGHRPRLELLGHDAPFGRPSNGAFAIRVERLALSLPTRQVR